ncbi:uncharacterized protein [Phyllobates terribilis]|uniref:uncharacterized protein n=1 Tax=Phyllobates terribilis TaxID=111132 RepID=UPI003CCA9F59
MGGEDADESQRLKRIAAAAYDYDNDSRWSDYWSNILMPPNMASRSEVIAHYKRKFYQRFVDPGLVVEPMSASNTSQPAGETTSSSSSSPPNNQQSRRPTSGSSARTSASSATTGQNPTSLRWDRQTVLFSVNAWICVLALLAMLPIVPKHLSNRAYRLSFVGTACSSAYSLYSLYGKPRSWNMQGVQIWLQSVIATKDFIYFMYSLMFVTSHLCLKFALISVLCRTLEHVAKFLRRNFSSSSLYRKYFEDLCVWVESNTTTLNILCSRTEVGLGFLLILSLFSWQRNVIQTFMYWQLLKLMYQAPVTSGYHQSVWREIGKIFLPFKDRYAPFLNTPLSYAQRWWFR